MYEVTNAAAPLEKKKYGRSFPQLLALKATTTCGPQYFRRVSFQLRNEVWGKESPLELTTSLGLQHSKEVNSGSPPLIDHQIAGISTT